MKKSKKCMARTNKTIRIIMLLFIITAAPALAIPQTYESTSVGRIVGDTPEEMRQQLARDDLHLTKAGFTDSSSPFSLGGPIEQVLSASFNQNFQKNPTNSWIQNSNKALLIYNSQSTADSHSSNQYFTITNLPQINNPESLIITNTQYSGISIPKTNSIADRLSQKATLIAPMADESQAFLTTLVCNIGRNNGLPIGETLRLARNNYHWNTNANNEIIGLTLLSYGLYGNPFAKAKVPQFSSSWRDYHCDDVLQDFNIATITTSQITNTTNGYQRTWTFDINNYNTEQIGNYTIINATGTENQYTPGIPVLPTRTITIPLPEKTIITSYNITYSNPANINANIPTWTGQNYTDRLCNQNQENETYSITQTSTPQNRLIITNLQPTRTNNCEQGDFTLYQTTTITLTYHPYSPILITSIEAPTETLPGQIKNITVNIENTESAPTTGTLYLKDNKGIISVKNISTTQTQHKLEIYAPIEEGKYTYVVEFAQNGNVKTNATFSTEVAILQADLETPTSSQATADITVHLNNKKNTPINTQITAHLTKNGQIITQQNKNLNIPTGESATTFTFTNLQKSDQNYDVLVTISYENKIITLAGLIVTNNPPIILNTNMIYREGDTVNITANATDPDGDAVTTNIISQPFTLEGYILNYEESGNYTYLVEATDGIATVRQELGILVQNTNRAPILNVPENITGTELSQITITANATDPDNENNVNNDNNNVTITYEWPLINGTFTPDENADREYYTTITASDGELSDVKITKIIVENLNRAPELNFTDITINETETLQLPFATDPDNENNATNDDQLILYRYEGAPIKYPGIWQTTYEDSGEYNVTMYATDRIVTTAKSATITVQNVNRPPIITAPERIYANVTVDLTIYATDPDNENSATNDDNNLTINCGLPFINCKWTPSQPGTANTYINLSDGEHTAYKQVYVYIEDTTNGPVQTPPENTTQQTNITPEPTLPENLTASNNTEKDTIQIHPNQEITPEIAKEPQYEIEIAGKKAENGNTIKVKPDKDYRIEITITNNLPEDKEIEIKLDLGNLEQDHEEKTNLKPGQKETLKFEFYVPRLTENEEYEIKIKIEEQTHKFKLKIEKPIHKIEFRQIKIEPASCTDSNLEITTKIENKGKNDEKGTLLIHSKLGNYTSNFYIPQGEHKIFKNTFTKTPGDYEIQFIAKYGKETEQEERTINIQECKIEETTHTNNAEPAFNNELIGTPAKKYIRTNTQYKDLAGIAFLTLLALFTTLIIITTIKLKE